MIQTLLLAVLLTAGVVLAGLWPIHVRAHTKIAVTSVPIYLAAVLLPPPLASVTAGIGYLVVEWKLRARHRTSFSTIAITVARWAVVSFLGASVAHWPSTGALSQAAVLLAAAAVLFLGDAVTVSLQIAPMAGESPWRVLRACITGGGPAELAQYALGILGALAALQAGWAILLIILPGWIVYHLFKNLMETRSDTRQMLESMADAVDLRDPCTGGHSRRVAESCTRIMQVLGILGVEAELIAMSARVHDVGKIGVPDAILLKPGALTSEERSIMESHAERGAALLSRYRDFARGVQIVRHHHERWDGKGYPQGLAGTDIPLGARVVAVADSYDAMTSDRPYRPALSMDQAKRILVAGRGTQWDPAIVEAFLTTLPAHADQPAPLAHQDTSLPPLRTERQAAAA